MDFNDAVNDLKVREVVENLDISMKNYVHKK